MSVSSLMRVQAVFPMLLALEIHGKKTENKREVKLAQLAQGLLMAFRPQSDCTRVIGIGMALMRFSSGNYPRQPKCSERIYSSAVFFTNLGNFTDMLMLQAFGYKKILIPQMLTLTTALGLWSHYAKPSSFPSQEESVPPPSLQLFIMKCPNNASLTFDLQKGASFNQT